MFREIVYLVELMLLPFIIILGVFYIGFIVYLATDNR
jgi:hypothetical protein